MADKVKITIDGIVKEVDAGSNVLQAILDDGQTIPHFCYHEALGAVGSCRLCACMISPAADKPARLEMSCMVRAAEGMVISVKDDYAFKFRKQVIEDLMLNHPHDCPVCDEGGECMLQDMTVLSQHQHRRNRFAKRTWENQDLGPFIHHEMNRCITCYRCVRYYRDYALGEDFGVYGSRDRVYFGRVEDGTLESQFSGNLVDVCPTGVFTDKQFRDHYTRPWDLLTTRSICPNCSVGCNVLPGYRHNSLRRVKPASNEAVNKYFMCDRGRYGGEFVNSELRLDKATIGGRPTSIDEAINQVAAKLKEIVAQHGPASIAGIGSDRASLEANAALHLLLKGLGSNRVTYFSDSDERITVRRAASITTSGEIAVPSISDIEKADFILILGGDISAEASRLELAVRQSVKNGNPLFICSPRAGELDKFSTASWRCLPGEEATIASFIGSVAPGSEPTDGNFVQLAAAALQKAKNPLVLCSALHKDSNLVEAAFALAKSATAQGNRSCKLAYFFPAVNSAGIGLMKTDESPDSIWEDIENGNIKALIIAERDLSLPPGNKMSLLSKVPFIVTIDSLDTPTAQASHAVIPCVSHYQSFGTLVNFEGRAQSFDGMQFSSAVNMAASEILTSLIQQAQIEDTIGGTDFHDIYDVTRETSLHMDRLRTGDAGCVIRSAPKLPPSSNGYNGTNTADGKLKRWDVYHSFGSDELSSLTAAISDLSPTPYIEINPDDAEALKATDEAEIDWTAEYGVAGKIRLNPNLAKGVIAVPVLVNIQRSVLAEVNP